MTTANATRPAIWPRIRDFLVYVLGQARTLKKPYPGIMHLLIFWGVLIQVVGTAIKMMQMSLFVPFTWPLFSTNVYLAYELIMDLAGIAIILGVVMAAFRRTIIRPHYMATSWDDVYALVLLFLLPSVGFITEGMRLYLDNPDWATWSPVGNLVAGLFRIWDISPSGMAAIHPYSFWLHVGLGLTFALSIPFTKMRHLVNTPLNIILKTDRPIGKLGISGGTEGAGLVTEFSTLDLLSFDACLQCGRCEEVCPATISGMAYSPRILLEELRESMAESLLTSTDGTVPEYFSDQLAEEYFWACSICGACLLVCPAFIRPPERVIDLRRNMVLEGMIDAELQDALTNLGRYGNSFGKSERMRARWTRSVEPEIKDALREPVEYLWFVGDYASYSPTLSEITKMTANVFQEIGLDFGVLYKGENHSGNDARRAGEEGLFEMLVEKNMKALSRSDYQAIVTTDPHSYSALKNEYPINNEQPILHYSELLAQLIDSGQLKFSKELGYLVTYHDPCYLGRYNGVYDAPRDVIEATGCKLVEMPRHGKNSFCCGAGGGRIWMEEGEMEERPSESRIHEAVALDGVSALVVACPKDVTMYADAVKTTGNEENIVVKDLIELVHEAL